MSTVSVEKIEELEYYFKKNGLWDIIIYNEISYRDLLGLLKGMHKENEKLKTQLDKLTGICKYKSKVLEIINDLTNNKNNWE
ncbi:MAG: hypothetical protein Q8942_02450 [Bacillota bacterium]|nr:hypothetical protein [Bacillota bacterium]